MTCRPMMCDGAADCSDRYCPGRVWSQSMQSELELTQRAIANRPALKTATQEFEEPWKPATTALIVMAAFVGLGMVLTLIVWGTP